MHMPAGPGGRSLHAHACCGSLSAIQHPASMTLIPNIFVAPFLDCCILYAQRVQARQGFIDMGNNDHRAQELAVATAPLHPAGHMRQSCSATAASLAELAVLE